MTQQYHKQRSLTADPAAAHCLSPPPSAPAAAAILANGDGNAAPLVGALPRIARIITYAPQAKGVAAAGQSVREGVRVGAQGAGEGGAEVGQGGGHGGGGLGNGGHGHC